MQPISAFRYLILVVTLSTENCFFTTGGTLSLCFLANASARQEMRRKGRETKEKERGREGKIEKKIEK